MRREIISKLIEYLKTEYTSYVPYGTFEDEEEGTGFRITEIPATFSVLSFGDTPENILDVQVESYPPGNYLNNVELEFDDFIQLIEMYRQPMSNWPVGLKE